ncbi:MAG: glycosyltransferase family A protein [Synechocystis sp.]|nr:glycosyltransferase family A protein [Synechocystis sp.]
MKNKPIVSVLMPVYNAERFLLAAINSILNQTFKDFEFIIIDDGSEDKSTLIAQDCQRQDSRITFIQNSHQGVIATRNLGLANAKAKYIAVMDADDIALPERLAKQVDFLETHADHVAVGSRVLLIDPDGWPIRPFSEHTSHQAIDQAHLHGEGGAMCHPSVLMRTEAVRQIGGYRTTLKSAEDIDLFLRLAEMGFVANLPEILLKYRMHPKSIGHSSNIEQKQFANLAIAEAYERRGLTVPQTTWRLQGVAASPSQMHCKWAWWALEAGHLTTARKNALLALANNPRSLENWRVTLCSLRGY